jgi:hypothetical protein
MAADKQIGVYRDFHGSDRHSSLEAACASHHNTEFRGNLHLSRALNTSTLRDRNDVERFERQRDTRANMPHDQFRNPTYSRHLVNLHYICLKPER